jgi:cell division protein FtsL
MTQRPTPPNTKSTPKKRKLRTSGVIFVVFLFTFVCYLASCIFLRSLNVSLNLTKQNYQSQIASMRRNNELLASEVSNLSNYDRVMNIVGGEAMSYNNNNVFTIGE